VVLFFGQFLYTTYVIEESVWAQLLPRKDEQIQFAELAGTLLTWSTFKSVLQGAQWTCFMDNQSIEKCIIKGSGGSPEANLAVGRLWLELSETRTAFEVWRVESHANVADGPSRFRLDEVIELEAEYVPPLLPAWFADVWCGLQQPA